MRTLLLLLVCVIGSVLTELRFAGVKVPPRKMNGKMARLECLFDLGGQPLYLVKWYKNRQEFFRYVPLNTPPSHAFPVNGIQVLMNESNQHVVTLGPLNSNYNGMYRCEVSADAPTFETDWGEGRMVVTVLYLAGVKVPPFKMFGETARLECPFELVRDRLYSVKWYKDNEEFFRYMNTQKQPCFVHPVDGIQVLMSESDKKFVTLGPLSLNYSGVYRCEVNAEKVSYASAMGVGRMTVIHLPTEDPQIQGKSGNEYETGDQLALNCTSAKSFPPARLSWFINDISIEKGAEQVKPQKMLRRERLLRELESESRLNITLLPEHFNANGEAKVRCVASIRTLVWQDGDERLYGNPRRPQIDFQNSFNSVTSPPVFQHDSTLLLVRGGVAKLGGSCSLVVTIGIFRSFYFF